MLNLFLRKYWLLLLLFITYHFLLFLNKINLDNPISYFNFIIYFITFLLIQENIAKSRFNKTIVYLFYYFYVYLSIIMSLGVLTRNIEIYSYVFYLYLDIVLKLLILTISIYLVFYSFKFWQKKTNLKILWAIIFATFVLIINYAKFIGQPFLLSSRLGWFDYATKNYITVVLLLFILLVYWFRYYQKYFVVSEYLNSVVFVFTLLNMIEALHHIAFQWSYERWFNGQVFNFIVNILMLICWYARYLYLNNEISIENERYLMNFQYLNGFVAKPRKSLIAKLAPFFSINNITASFVGIIFIFIGLYFIKKITLYLLLNTFIILLTVFLALFFSLSSIRRDWQNQVGILLKDKWKK